MRQEERKRISVYLSNSLQSAIFLLESRRRVFSNRWKAETARERQDENKNGPKGVSGKPSLQGMSEWLQQLGHLVSTVRMIKFQG
jgi:hypothetical protein